MLAGAILGLVGSAIPELFKAGKEWLEHKKEIERMELEIKHARELAQIRIQEERELAQIKLDGKAYEDIGIVDFEPTGFKFADTLQVIGNFLNQSVRPVLTYLICGGWLLMKVSMWKQLGFSVDQFHLVWTEADSNFVATVITFWFGNRAFMRTFGRVK